MTEEDGRTNGGGKWKIEQYSVGPETAKGTKRESVIFVIVFIFCIIGLVPSILLLLPEIYVLLFVHLPASFMEVCNLCNHILFHSSTSCFCELNNSYWPRLSLVRFTNGRHPVAHLAHLLA